MAEHEHHCPFLNRPDARCAEHFHLDQLDYTFDYCFDQYQACPTYLERLRERRVRMAVGASAEVAGATQCGSAPSGSAQGGSTHDGQPSAKPARHALVRLGLPPHRERAAVGSTLGAADGSDEGATHGVVGAALGDTFDGYAGSAFAR